MNPSVLLATPAYGGMMAMAYSIGVVEAVRELERHRVYGGIRTIGNESLITRARCRLVHDFLKGGCTHLFFIDADVGFSGIDIARMVGKQMRHGFDVMAGLYPKKLIFWPGVISAAGVGASPEVVESAGARFPMNLKGDKHQSIEDCIEVYDAPTGFMLIPRETIERVIEANPNDWYISDADSDRDQPTYLLFDTIIDRDRRFLSEDYAFCRKVQALGMKIWVDMSVELSHIGNMKFKGRIADLFEQVPEAKEVTP